MFICEVHLKSLFGEKIIKQIDIVVHLTSGIDLLFTSEEETISEEIYNPLIQFF